MKLETFLREIFICDGTHASINSTSKQATFGGGMLPDDMEEFIEHLSEDGRAQAQIQSLYVKNGELQIVLDY